MLYRYEELTVVIQAFCIEINLLAVDKQRSQEEADNREWLELTWCNDVICDEFTRLKYHLYSLLHMTKIYDSLAQIINM